MKVVQVKCPQCGAVLDPPAAVQNVTCTYCGATAVVQREAPPVRQVPGAAPGPLPEAAARTTAPTAPGSSTRRNVIGGLVLLAVAGTIVTIKLLDRAERQARRDAAEWYGTTRALLVDVTGDGRPEVIGRIRRLGANPIRESLAALDAKTGRKLWETPALPPADSPYRTLVAAAGELLVFVDAVGNVQAFGLVDGRTRWTAELGEAASSVFTLPDGTLRFSTIDGALHALGPDGSPRPIEEGGPLGRRRPADAGAPSSAVGELPFEVATAFQERGMTTGQACAGGAPGQPWVVLGHRARGSAVPMLGAATDDGAVLWTSDIPGSEPLAASNGTLGLERIAVGPDRVFAVYDRGSGPEAKLQATAFDRATGERLWEVELPEPAPVSGLTVGDGVLYVSYWGQLAALDATTGRPLFLASPIR
jgi:hypothetical protein